MPQVVEHRKFVCVCFDETNNNKFWNITLYDDDSLLVEFGRVGKTHTPKEHPDGGRAKFEKLIHSKTKASNKPDKLYTENKVLEGTSSAGAKSASSHQLKDIVKKQIKASCPLVQSLIDDLIKANAHQILMATSGSIQYDTDSAQFKTPQGVIVPDQVQEARDLLVDLADSVVKQGWDDSFFKRNLNDYLRLIPHAVGMKKIDPQALLPDLAAIQKENVILDGLTASFADITSHKKSGKGKKTVKTDEPKVFDVELVLVKDKGKFDKINQKYERTKKSMHTSHRFRLRKIYQVAIATERASFEKYGKPLGNTMELFHGTKFSNVLSIMKQGLIIPPSSSGHVTGRMFSDGIYGSDISSKALNYATNFWGGGGSTSRTFMFLADFAMGKTFIPQSGYYGSYPKAGHDSTFAKSGVSGVHNNEMIVYKTNQVTLKYLLEFE